MKSAYILELSPRAPQIRWGALHVANEPEALRSALEQFCRTSGDGPFHTIISGTTLGVWVVQRGVVSQFIDLHPFLRADLGNGARTLADLWSDERTLREWGSEAMDDVDPWLEKLHLEVFWDPIAELLPPLQGPVLGPNETTPFEYGTLSAQGLKTRLAKSNPMKLGALPLR